MHAQFIKFFAFIFFLFTFGILWAAPKEPILIDYQLQGKGSDIYFEPNELNLYVAQSYLFLIQNPFEESINIILGDLGKNIYTHYLQGVPGFSQSSMLIPGKTKVTWVFEIKKPGQYKLTPMNMGMGQKGQTALITVTGKAAETEQFSQEELAHFEKLKAALANEKGAQSNQKSSVDKNKASGMMLAKNRPWRELGGRPD